MAAAGCQSGGVSNVLGLGGGEKREAACRCAGRQGAGERVACLLPAHHRQGRREHQDQLRQGRRRRSGQARLSGVHLRLDAQLQSPDRHAGHGSGACRTSRARPGGDARHDHGADQGDGRAGRRRGALRSGLQPAGLGRIPGPAVRLQGFRASSCPFPPTRRCSSSRASTRGRRRRSRTTKKRSSGTRWSPSASTMSACAIPCHGACICRRTRAARSAGASAASAGTAATSRRSTA